MNSETITALSTAPFMSAIAVIRISGDKTFDIIDKIFSKTLKNAPGNTVHHGFIQNEDGKVLDDVLVTVFKKPNSYTGEDVAEISCHGSLYIINSIQNLIISNGGRQAHNGEFTKRAFLNGKLDMLQVEAVIDLIESQSEKEVTNAITHLKGDLSKKINIIREDLLNISSQIMAYIDFPDDEIADVSEQTLSLAISTAIDGLNMLIKSFNTGQIIKNGIKTIITGKPNVGKSLLMNRLLGYDRSIVTEIKGTTRDIIEETATFGDLKLVISDTAGIRQTVDTVEQIGVERALDKIKNSDLILCVFDNSKALDEEDLALYSFIKDKKCKKMAVLNKTDLGKSLIESEQEFFSVFDSKVVISALEGSGFENLEQELKNLFTDGIIENKNEIITNSRQYQCLVTAKHALDRAYENRFLTPDVIEIDIEEAISSLGEIMGKTVNAEIIENIFSRFCVGK